MCRQYKVKLKRQYGNEFQLMLKDSNTKGGITADMVSVLILNADFASEMVEINPADVVNIRRTNDLCTQKATNTTSQRKLTIEHEMCHLYGAQDYYCAGVLSQNEAQYCQAYYSGDVMLCNYGTCSSLISSATAYSIGWLDRLDSTVFNNVFKSKQKK